jgi:hypothetical protein
MLWLLAVPPAHTRLGRRLIRCLIVRLTSKELENYTELSVALPLLTCPILPCRPGRSHAPERWK